MTITADALTKVHLGARLDDGVIRWSADTERRALDLVTAQTRDAVEAYLTPDYLTAKISEIQDKAITPIADAPATVELVAKQCAFSAEQQATILDHFIRGGQPTAGGLMQAVASAAHTLPDADAAHGLESSALPALDLAATRH